MKKIGIVTFHHAENYGAILQAIALQNTLKILFPKYTVGVVDYKSTAIVKAYQIFVGFRMETKLWKKFLKLLVLLVQLPFIISRKNNFRSYLRKEIFLISRNDINNETILVCGSDQIWNPEITNGLDMHYFGRFDQFSGTAISYAASDGGKLAECAEAEVRENIKNLRAISVREESMVLYLQGITNKQINLVLDPVFLPEATYWMNKATSKIKPGYILVYRLEDNPTIIEEAYEISKTTGLRIIEITNSLPIRSLCKTKHQLFIGVSPKDFISFFKNAEIVLTNSFHGTAFSIIFEKRFFAYQIKNRSQRITTLLNMLGISDRYVLSAKEVFETELDYSNIVLELKRLREISIGFLSSSIEMATSGGM